jgi:Zn-dependent protease
VSVCKKTHGFQTWNLKCYLLVSEFACKSNLYRYSVGAEVMRTSDLSGLFQFASVININLAVVNILPLPALDGVGRWHVDSP